MVIGNQLRETDLSYQGFLDEVVAQSDSQEGRNTIEEPVPALSS